MAPKNLAATIVEMGSAFVVWLLVACLVAAGFCGVALLVAKGTGSGLGSCGPYGPLGGIVILMMLGSLPAGILAGIVAASLLRRRYFTHENKA